jgi:glucosylceramidase
MHIGSCDFALSAYSYDDNGGTADPTLANFSIANDMTYIIPGLTQANTATGGKLKILGSMWTAPPRMKSQAIYNGSYILPANYGALATYFSKYVQAYKAANLNIWAVTPTNEPLGVGGSRESQVWTPAQMNTFIQANLGPALQPLGTKIYIFDHNKGDAPPDGIVWATLMYGDAKTSPFVSGSAVHWYGSTFKAYESILDQMHMIDTSKDVLYDEGVADGLIFNNAVLGPIDHTAPWWQNDAWYWDPNEWDWGSVFGNKADHPKYATVTRYLRDIMVGLNHWYTGWIEWNSVLNKYGAQDAKGGGIGMASPTTYSNTRGQPGVSHIENGNPAGIMIDENPAGGTNQTGTIYYTPIYYAFRHISHFIQPGATVLLTTYGTAGMGDNTTTTAQTLFATSAHNPDGSTAVVVFNSATAPVNYTVQVGTQAADGTIPAQAIQTLLWH